MKCQSVSRHNGAMNQRKKVRTVIFGMQASAAEPQKSAIRKLHRSIESTGQSQQRAESGPNRTLFRLQNLRVERAQLLSGLYNVRYTTHELPLPGQSPASSKNALIKSASISGCSIHGKCPASLITSKHKSAISLASSATTDGG